ncbi:MAG: hypothetical protein ACI3YO_10830 [Prevotella sp.]
MIGYGLGKVLGIAAPTEISNENLVVRTRYNLLDVCISTIIVRLVLGTSRYQTADKEQRCQCI